VRVKRNEDVTRSVTFGRGRDHSGIPVKRIAGFSEIDAS